MITRIRSWTALAGRTPELAVVLKQIAAIAAKASGTPPGIVATTVGGSLGEVSLILTGDGVDAHDEIIAKLIANPEISALITKLASVVESSGREVIYRHV
jgi:hypothetical protein